MTKSKPIPRKSGASSSASRKGLAHASKVRSSMKQRIRDLQTAVAELDCRLAEIEDILQLSVLTDVDDDAGMRPPERKLEDYSTEKD